MSAYLKIENPGVADSRAFTLLGASTSRNSDNNKTIGKFGSGNKHGVADLLRHGLSTTIFGGSLSASCSPHQGNPFTATATARRRRRDVSRGEHASRT